MGSGGNWLCGKVGRGGACVAGIKCACDDAAAIWHGIELHDFDFDGFIRTGLHAGRGFTFREAALAHVAFAHNATLKIELRHLIRAFQNAVAATDALVIEMAHNAGDGVFVIGEHRAAIRTGGIGAVMAGGGDGLQVGLLARANEQAHVAPAFAFIESIQRMAGGHAGLAAGAGIEIDLEAILLTGIRFAQRDEMREALANRLRIILFREKSDGSAEGLLVEEGIIYDF